MPQRSYRIDRFVFVKQRQPCQSWRSVAAPSVALISRSFLARESSWVMWLQGWFFSHFTSQENDPQVNCSSLFTLEDVTPVPGEKSPTCHIYENISRRKTCCIEAACVSFLLLANFLDPTGIIGRLVHQRCQCRHEETTDTCLQQRMGRKIRYIQVF